jgi:hypothetical protein
MRPNKTNGYLNEDLEKMCLRKRYRNCELTTRAVGIHLSEILGCPVYVYHCPHCHGYHLTTKKHSLKHDVYFLEIKNV